MGNWERTSYKRWPNRHVALVGTCTWGWGWGQYPPPPWVSGLGTPLPIWGEPVMTDVMAKRANHRATVAGRRMEKDYIFVRSGLTSHARFWTSRPLFFNRCSPETLGFRKSSPAFPRYWLFMYSGIKTISRSSTRIKRLRTAALGTRHTIYHSHQRKVMYCGNSTLIYQSPVTIIPLI